MQNEKLHHGGSKDAWKLLHTDQDLDGFMGHMGDWDEPYPEPILVEM